MATSGYISYGDIIGEEISSNGYKLSWERIDYSIADNRSIISWTFSIRYQTGVTIIGSKDYSIIIDGNTYTDSITGHHDAGWETIKTGTTAITHLSDGSKTFNLSFECEEGLWTTASASGTGTLDVIPRPTVIVTAENFTEFDTPTITYGSPSGTIIGTVEACISLTGETDDISYREVGASGTYTFKLTGAERSRLSSAIISGTSTTVRFYIRNTIEGKSFLSYLTKTYSLQDYIPIFFPTAEDVNPVTTALTGNNIKLIRYYSNVSLTLGTEAPPGATIVSRSVINGGRTFYIEDADEDTILINNVESNTFYLSATDNRGYTGKDALVFSEDDGYFIPYVKLTNNLSTDLLSPTGELTFTVKGKYFDGSFGAKNNSLEVEYLVLDENGDPVFNTEGSGWVQLGVVSPLVTDNNYEYSYTITGLEYTSIYELTVNVIDELTPVQTVTKIVSAEPIFDWNKDSFQFNVPVYLKDKKIPLSMPIDEVIEQGTSGTWFYRKWSDGRVELYGYQNISDVACNVTLGGMYRTEEQTAPSFPFTVYSAKAVASYETDGYGALIWTTKSTTSTKPFSYYLIRPTSSSGITGQVIFHIQGSWY